MNLYPTTVDRARPPTGPRRGRRLAWIGLAVAAVLVTVPSAGATSARLVTGRQIKDSSVTGRDIRDGSLRAVDFGHLRPGPAGPEGAQGVPGPPGAPGAAGTSGWVTVVSNGVASSTIAHDSVDCPPGLVAVSGGLGTTDFARTQLVESAPEDDDTWGVTARLFTGTHTIFAWAICTRP